jgi:hypothetical protein
MKSKVSQYLLVLLLGLLCNFTAVSANAWIDSAIADLTRQMIRAQFLAKHNAPDIRFPSQTQSSQSNAFNIVIDLAKWQPIVNSNDSGEFYYHKFHADAPTLTLNQEFNYQDSINAFNRAYMNHENYVAYYNVVLQNFPLNLVKDVSSNTFTYDNTLYNQLTQLKAVKNEDWNEAVNSFAYIISAAINNIQVLFNRQRVVVFGSCGLKGYYGPRYIKRVGFYLTSVQYSVALNNENWIAYLQSIPGKFQTPGIPVTNVQERNRDVALGIQYYLACNLYGDCTHGGDLFGNRQARWLYQNLSPATNIDKAKLYETCLDLNGLSEFRAWQVLMAGYDDQLADLNSPTHFIYTGATNATLDKIRLRVPKIKRAEKVIKDAGVPLSRDSVLYFGYLMYRDTGYWREIPLMRRVSLMKTLTSAQCKDYTGIAEANNPAAFCETLTILLFDKLPAGDEKNLLALLKTQQLLEALTFRLDESTVGFFGKNNYTNFILTLCKYWRKAYPEKLSAGKNSTVNTAVFAWDDDFFNQNAIFSMNWATHTVQASQKQKRPLYGQSSPEMQIRSFDVYDPVMVNPLNDNQTLGLPAGQQFVVPALFMDWLSHKKTWADLGVATEVTLATLGMAFGVGEIYYAGNALMRCVGILLTVANTGELILINNTARQAVLGCFATAQEGEDFLKHYHHTVMLLNVAVIGRDLITDFGAELRAYRLAYQSKQGQLQAALGVNSAEFRALEELNEAVVAVGEENLPIVINIINEDGFAIIKDANGIIVGRAWLSTNNELNLFIKTTGTTLQGNGRQVFNDLFLYVNTEFDDIFQIRGTWKSIDGLDDNLVSFNNAINSGKSPTDAAFETFTGKMAQEKGFINASVLPTSLQENGIYSNVDVIFTK